MVFPTSFAQQRLWLLAQIDPGRATYHVGAALLIEGALEVEALRKAFGALVERHEALRTTLRSEDGRAVQVIAPTAPAQCWPLPVTDVPISPDTIDDGLGHARDLARVELVRPFDLERGPLFRTMLLRLGAAQHILVIVMHHVVADGWSVGILVHELGVFYQAALAGRPLAASLRPLEIQYADFAGWQRQVLQGERLASALRYWRRQFGRPEDGSAADVPLPRPAQPAS